MYIYVNTNLIAVTQIQLSKAIQTDLFLHIVVAQL